MNPVRFALLILLLTAACSGRGPTTPTSQLPQVSATPTPTPSTIETRPTRDSIPFDMSGVVTDVAGRPVAGAKVIVWRDYEQLATFVTESTGRYTVQFSGAPGSFHAPHADPPGTEDAVAFLEVEARGFERVAHFILGTTQQFVQDVQLQPVKRIASGETAILSIGAQDTVCAVDAWPWRGQVCGIVHVIAETNGLMTIEASPAEGQGIAPILEVYSHSDRSSGTGNPVSIPVAAGSEYIVDVALPWGMTQSLVLKTSLDSDVR
jgi:hypothetical protein